MSDELIIRPCPGEFLEKLEVEATINTVEKCVCGADPIVEEKPVIGNHAVGKVFKYRCPNCKEKELPWIGQWDYCGALHDWNRIAHKRTYHRRTLEYNINGVCVSPPYKTFEWRGKNKAYEMVIIDFYLDNSMYYFCYEYFYQGGGHAFAVSVNSNCYPSFEIAKKVALKKILRDNKALKKIAMELLSPKQGELF